jgi:hypothetical protein
MDIKKPSNCTCAYPKVICRNLSGHAAKCPCHLKFLEEIDQYFENTQITPEQWKEIDKEMNSLFGRVELFCDGFTITIKYISGNKPTDLQLATYVNGSIKGEWFCKYGKDNEPTEAKFYPIKSTYAYPAKSRKMFEKLSKKDQKAALKYHDPYSKVQYRNFFFGSMRSLKKHFKTVCKSIVVLKIGDCEFTQVKKSPDNPTGIDR